MNDHESNFSHTNGDGAKSTNEEPAQEFQQFIYNVEEVSQRRPAVRFGALVLAVGVGSYFGVGRHVKKLTTEVKVLQTLTSGIGEFLLQDLETRKYQSAAIYSAIDRGQDFVYFPGLGVLLGDAAKAAKGGS